MTTLYDDELDVHYGFIFVQPAGADPDLLAARGGQVNGLCGAAEPGTLSLITGLHTGSVPLRVELLDAEPPIGREWEEVVEVSMTTSVVELYLASFDAFEPLPPLPAPGTYRVRYSAVGMDAAHRADVRSAGEPAVDRYLLQLWPAPAEPDAVLRETSGIAAYWHGVARDTPPPPTTEQIAAATAAQAEQDRLLEQRGRAEAERQRAEQERREWGGRPPTDRLRALGHDARSLAGVDRALADALADLPPGRQRALAAWAARWSCEQAGVDQLDWLAPALEALSAGRPLPAMFDEPRQAWARMFPGPTSYVATFVSVSPSGAREEPPQLAPEAAALSAVLAAAHPDPGRAAVGALKCAGDALSDRSGLYAAAHRLIDEL